MFAHVPGDGAGVSIKSSTGGKPDDDSDGFAFIKIFCGGGGSDRKQSDDCCREQTRKLPHRDLLLLASFGRSSIVFSTGELPEANRLIVKNQRITRV
jgi:hypothetical protein